LLPSIRNSGEFTSTLQDNRKADPLRQQWFRDFPDRTLALVSGEFIRRHRSQMMFDARSLIEMMMKGSSPQQRSTPDGTSPEGGLGGLGDILSQLGGNTSGQGQGGGLNDLLRNLTDGQKTQETTGQAPTGSPSTDGGLGGLGDILNQLQGKDGQGSGSILDTLGGILGQATDGAKEGAGKIGEATGARELIEKMSGGRDPNELLQQLQDLVANNKLGAGAALGGLGALVFGTRTGRSVAVNAAKLGALALIGGLAYKAYQNYSQGQAPAPEAPTQPEPAPSGSGFEESSVSDTAALTYLRGMIAAAASDGRLDADEQQKITANLSAAGLDREAEEFIAREVNAPASIEDLANGISNEREAIQLYTAARLAIEVDTAAEEAFLAQLASRTGIDPQLARHIDATAQNVQS
jgi:uncharacterized membrane protein YebE (DUF533 family)